MIATKFNRGYQSLFFNLNRSSFERHSVLITAKRFLSSQTIDNSPKSLTKKDLCEIIAEEHDLSVSKSKRILNTVFDSIVEVRIESFFLKQS